MSPSLKTNVACHSTLSSSSKFKATKLDAICIMVESKVNIKGSNHSNFPHKSMKYCSFLSKIYKKVLSID